MIKNKIIEFFLGPVKSIRLHTFTTFFSISFLIYMIERVRFMSEWLTEEGYHLTAETKRWYDINPFPLLSYEMAIVFSFFLITSVLFVIFNFKRKITLWIVFAFSIYAQNVDMASAFSLNKWYIFVFFFLAISPKKYFKVVTEEEKTVKYQSVWPIRIIQLTFLIVYCTAGTCKIFYGDWLDNPDVLLTHVQGFYCTDFAAYLLRTLPRGIWSMQAYIALGFEVFAPILFFFKKLRPMAFVIGIGFHLIIALTMYKLIFFSLQMISFYTLFISSDFLEKSSNFINNMKNKIFLNSLD